VNVRSEEQNSYRIFVNRVGKIGIYLNNPAGTLAIIIGKLDL